MILLGYAGDANTITKEDAQKLTHINVAFGKLKTDGSIDISHLNMTENLNKLRQWNPGLKIAVSIVPKEGHANAFTACAASPALRQKVAEASAELILKYGYNGVDFDWEFPCVPSNGMAASPADKENYTLLLKEVRKAADACGGGLVTVAAGADLYYAEGVELLKLAEILDYICLMTYDLKCGFHALAGHHTALFSSTGDVFKNSCDQALRLFESHGFPKEKLLMGAAFYSRKWVEVKNSNNGFLQISPKGGGYGPGYGDLAENYVNKQGFTRYWDDEAKAPWLFDGTTFLSYDDEDSLAHKAAYVKQRGYGGIFYWEHKCDPSRKLLNTLYEGLK